jgi:alkanesulfonate monooxygenase SsuD/methylene tetrahydromethanopterin reductase-like flavin-dependent oxidoreductase (luciferase family)
VFAPQEASGVAGLAATAKAAEASGFDSFWVMDHLFVPGASQVDVTES